MEQVPAHAIGFREVDRDGNEVPADAGDGLGGNGGTGRVNPFVVALWLLAALLIGGGMAAIFGAAANTMPVNGQMPVSYLVLTFAPYLVVTGVATVAGLLFWHAVLWQRRRA